MERFDERDNVQARNDARARAPGTTRNSTGRIPSGRPRTTRYAAYRGWAGSVIRADLPFVGAQIGSLALLGMSDRVDGPVAPARVALSPERAAEKVKSFARFLGADLVRIGPLNPAYVYTQRRQDLARSGALLRAADGSAAQQRRQPGRRALPAHAEDRAGGVRGDRDHARLRAAGYYRRHPGRLHPVARIPCAGPRDVELRGADASPSPSRPEWENSAGTAS